MWVYPLGPMARAARSGAGSEGVGMVSRGRVDFEFVMCGVIRSVTIINR